MKTIVAPARSTAATTSASRFEPPGWMIAVTPGSSASAGPSGNGKKASEASAAPAEVVAVLARLLEREPHRVDAAHLAGADPDRPQVLGDHDRVRGDVLADAPGEEQVAPVRLARLAADDDHRLAVLDVDVAVLGEQAADDPPVVALAGGRAPPLGRVEDPQRLLRAQHVERALLVPGREQHLDELLRDPPGELGRDRAVEHDHAAVGRHRVRRERARVGVLDRARDCDAARVRVLDDHAGRQRELVGERRAADRSLRLLYESSFPPSCSTRESRWRRAPASA